MSQASVSPWNYAVTMLEMFNGGRSLMTGSAVFWLHEGNIYVVSAWHVFAAMNSEQFLRGDTQGHLAPDGMCFHVFRKTGDAGDIAVIRVSIVVLVSQPAWLQHPTHGKTIDIAAFKIPPGLISSEFDIRPANTLESASGGELRIAQKTFMIGWTGAERCPPTWKRGTIAVEPNVSWTEQAPRVICVDCAAPAGFSGAPLIVTDARGAMVGQGASDRVIGLASASSDSAGILHVVRREYIDQVVAGGCGAQLA